MARYEPPEWGVNGRNVFGIYLEVIKNGVVKEKLTLPLTTDSSCVVAGRMETQCDLVLAHPSISRVHGALQFDEQGALFLCDLRSTHGCYVNKKRVKAEDFVRLHIGDVLCFGESTRLYAVCGPAELLPAEYDSLNLTKFREKLDKKKELREKKKQEEERGASWGFGEDAEEESEEEEEEEQDQDKNKEQLPDYLRNLKEDDQPYKSSVSKTEVSEKDQRIYQQLQTRIRKMENLKLERSRILAKQHQLDGLTEGQQRTLDRNEQRIDALMKEIDDLEGRIHAKNDQRSKTNGASGAVMKKRNVNEELYGYSSDEDDFYDRTRANQQKIAARKQKLAVASSIPAAAVAVPVNISKNETLTVDSIQTNIKKLESELAEIEKELTVASVKSTKTQAQESKQAEEVDSLDSFMAATTSQLHVNRVETIMKRKLEVDTELMRQQQLLAVATPALASLPVQTSISRLKKEKDSSAQSTSPDRVPSEATPTVSKMEQTPVVEIIAKKQQVDAVKPPVAKETLGNTAHPTSSIISKTPPEGTEPGSSTNKRRRIAGPARGPPVKTKMDTTTIGNQLSKTDTSILEGGDQVWVPPTNQTGDGRTNLNDKFGY